MEENNNLTGATDERTSPDKHTVPLSRRMWLELLEILSDVAFPIIGMIVINTTIISFASYHDFTTSILALIGGEIMMTVALVIFGRANGNAAYNKTVLNNQKRALGSTEEKVVCGAGEYALWKGVLIGAILCIPFVLLQIIELCYHNAFCEFCLKYVCGWAYYPFSYLGKGYQALNFIMVILPIAAHTVAYYLGKLKQIKIQEAVAAKNASKKRRKK
ncbi:MAG: hypothetical protein K2K04_03755 [Clostridia bacterium]|nr:hypothetical protein [Clostridia bacterium]